MSFRFVALSRLGATVKSGRRRVGGRACRSTNKTENGCEQVVMERTPVVMAKVSEVGQR